MDKQYPLNPESLIQIAPARRMNDNQVANVITNGFLMLDRKWTVTYWNKSAEKLLRIEAKDIVGQNFWEVFAGILPLSFYTVYQKAFEIDYPVQFEEYWAEMGAWFNVIAYQTGDHLSVSFKCSNQPENSEQKLKVLHELYLFVTEVTNDCLWEWYLQAKQFFWIDGGHKRLFGFPIENSLIPQSFWESRIHPDDKKRLSEKLQKIIDSGTITVWEEEYRLKKADGIYAYVHDRGHIFYDDNKNAIRMIGATQDITVRKTAEIQLLESEWKLSLIATQTTNAVTITDAEEKILWVNRAFTEITEYEPEEVMGKKPGSFLQGKDTDSKTIQYLHQQVTDKQPFDCNILNYSKSGRAYWVHIQGQALFDEEGKLERYFTIQADVTEKIELENNLQTEQLVKQKEITAAILTAQENERGEIGVELHDNVNQILAVAKLYLQMTKKSYDGDQEYLDKSISYIMSAIDEIRNIAKKLIIPAVNEIGLFDNIKNLLADLLYIQPVEFEFQAKGIVEKELNSKLQVAIFRIVQEQVNNILKHANASQASIHLSKRNGQLGLLISDNGVGYDFAKDKNGVGIINIKSRVVLYNGKVVIASKPGKGFKLKVTLPLTEVVVQQRKLTLSNN